MLTVLVVPKTLLREGLASLLAPTRYKPMLSVSCLDELPESTARDSQKALFIVSRDALIKGGRDAMLPGLTHLCKSHPDSRVLVLSDSFSFADVVAALRAGANGYVMSTLTPDALLKSLDLVALGETVLTSEFAKAVSDMRSKGLEIAVPPRKAAPTAELNAPRQPIDTSVTRQLSGRETAILSRLVRGDSNKHIARGMGVAEATVKTHIKAILRKIQVKNRTQAAMWAYTNLLPSPGMDLAAAAETIVNGEMESKISCD